VRPAGLTKENVKESKKINNNQKCKKKKGKTFPSRHRDGPATNVKRVEKKEPLQH
jgi:hypothetical protein